MSNFKSAWIAGLFAFTVGAVVSITCGKDSNKLCTHEYALCTSAPCVPLPGDPTKAICSCSVHEGKSMSTASCDSIAPSTGSHGIRTVYSTFSLHDFELGKQGMKCPSGTPWTWCLNKRCTVNPGDPSRAVCTCDVLRTGEWTTLGGGCDTSTCETAYWSGASIPDFESGAEFMVEALGLEKSPVEWCAAP